MASAVRAAARRDEGGRAAPEGEGAPPAQEEGQEGERLLETSDEILKLLGEFKVLSGGRYCVVC